MTVHYDMLPKHMREPAQLYIEEGYPVGDFLTAVLRNRFVEAIGSADIINSHHFKEWARWLHNEVPIDAWGSAEKMHVWQESGGLKG